ncbi:tubulin-specific chaperone D [Biomphalaria glabrata]|nr:tubulin-specific chaperone D-like [Biomphalaria glabrata]
MATIIPTDSSGDGDGNNIPEEDKCLVHETFKEADEIRSLIKNVVNIWEDPVAMEMAAERFRIIVDDYQEQPHLIDPYLEEFLVSLLEIGKKLTTPKPVSKQVFTYLYLITKMRGFKYVVKLLPHEVSDMEPLLTLIELQDPNDHELWETRYMLLVWLSIVCLIPFDLKRLDSNLNQGDGNVKAKTMDRIMTICKTYLSVNDKSRDAAGYLMSRFLTRPDVKQVLLPQSLDWMMQILKTSDYTQVFDCSRLCGVLNTLALLFKHGKREDLLQYAPVVMRVTLDAKLEECNSCVLRKMVGKLIQRLGLTFLKYRVTSWRYQRGNRSLALNLGEGINIAAGGLGSSTLAKEEDEENDVPEEIEEIIEHLLIHMKDKETIVRWTAAKGIGRVTGQLPKELADDVVGSVLDLFTFQESDGAWHGGCLALAELGRRGLLLPERLKDVVPVIMKALMYDEKRGNFSVGAHVRDAACYVCWAFARAYEPQDILPYVHQISNYLIIVSVFDREVNVRRAAAAAFQENVGRQGTFPHGIEILTTVDYFAVGNRPKCYLELSMFIAKFEEYTQGVIDHLVDVKLSHWDSTIRELSSKALHRLTACAPQYMASQIIPKLLSWSTGLDLFQRHGSILAIAEIVHALYLITQSKNESLVQLLGEDIIDKIQDICRKLHDLKMFKRHGGEFMRISTCCLIEKCSVAKLPFHNKPVVEMWRSVIDECLTRIEPEIQAAAISAIPSFFSEYYTQPDGTVSQEKQASIISQYLSELKSSNQAARQGHSLAIGALPRSMLKGQLKTVLSGLRTASQITEKQMAEARRDAIIALSNVCKTVGVEHHGNAEESICADNVDTVYTVYLEAMKDYTLDSRGDIGAWVREASMQALHDLTILIVNSGCPLLTPETVKQVFCSLIQQALEKIDRTRRLAGILFTKLLYHKPSVPYIPQEAEVKSICPEILALETNWAAEADTYPIFSKLLALETYTYSVLLGLVVSVGGLTESLVKFSSASLQEYIKSLSSNQSQLVSFMEVLLRIFKDYQKDDRVPLPMMKTIDHILSWGLVDSIASDNQDSIPDQIVDLVKLELYRSGSPQKLMAGADVFCDLLQFDGSPRKKSLNQLMMLLCHKYPRVRKTTANKLYEALLTYDEVVPPENTGDVMAVLSETSWDVLDMNDIREQRNRLCELLHIKAPVFVKKT